MWAGVCLVYRYQIYASLFGIIDGTMSREIFNQCSRAVCLQRNALIPWHGRNCRAQVGVQHQRICLLRINAYTVFCIGLNDGYRRPLFRPLYGLIAHLAAHADNAP